MILDVFEKAFKGCGTTLEKALNSERYGVLLQNQDTFFERYPANIDEGIALRAGHLEMGKLFNTLPEREAIEQAKNLPVLGRGIEHRALIQLLGEQIVAEAEKCLPEEALEMADDWKQADSERQVEIAKNLYLLFGSASQRQEKEMNWQTMQEGIEDDFRYNYSGGAERFLPRLYGKWDKENCPADCEGKTQMLVAFARLANTAVLIVNPMILAKDVIEEWRIEVCQKIEKDILRRNIEPDTQMWESLQAQQQWYLVKKFRMPVFHCGVALQLKNNRWVLIDPHSLDWGVFPEIWGIDNIWQILSRYQEVLPGLSLISHDHGITKGLREQELQEVESLLERSRVLEAKLGDNPILDAIDILVEKPSDLELILRDLCELEPALLETLADNPDLRRYFASIVVISEELTSVGTMFRLTTDEELIRKKIGSLLTTYHCIAMNRLRNQFTDSGQLLHPVCEFSLPEYSIAMSVINSLNCDEGTISQEFFLDYEFSQPSLGNAMTEIFPKRYRQQNPELARAAAKVLRALPFMHSRCQQFLRLHSNLF